MTKLCFLATLAASSAMLLASCTNENGMGAEIMPSSDKPGIYTIDTISVEAYTMLEDTVYSGMQANMIIGYYEDPIFGSTTASFAEQFTNTSYGTFPDQAVCDSVVLTLGIETSSFYYGDASKEMTIEVYKLTSPITTDGDYYGNTDLSAYCGEKIGQTTIIPNQLDTCIKFNLDASYGDEIIQNVSAETYEDNVYGLYFKPSATNQGGCVIKTSATSDYTQYYVYYHTDSDTSSVLFSIDGSYDARATSYQHDYSTTQFADQLNNPETIKDNNNLYIQCMSGTKVKLKFPQLQTLNNLEGKYIILNRAQLICPLADSSFTEESQYEPLDYLLCTATYKETQGTKTCRDLLDSTLVSSYYSTYSYYLKQYMIDTINHRYSINLTERIKDMLNTYQQGNEPDYDLYLLANGRVSDFKRVVLSAPNKDNENFMKLVIEYISYEK